MSDIHDNSRKSFRENEDSGKGETYRRKIVSLLTNINCAMTDRQILKALEAKDFNNIRPEITRLKQAGILEEAERVKCEETGKTVRTVQIRKKEFSETLF